MKVFRIASLLIALSAGSAAAQAKVEITDVSTLKKLADATPSEHSQQWRDRLPSDLFEDLSNTLMVKSARLELSYGGKASRDLYLVWDAPSLKTTPSRWLIANTTSPACTLEYRRLAYRLENHPQLNKRERLDAQLAHYSIAYEQCSGEATLAAVALRYLYAVALKDLCRGYDYLTCGDAYDAFKALLPHIDSLQYQDEKKGADKQAAVPKEEVLKGLNQIIYHNVTLVAYFKLKDPDWKDVNVCPIFNRVETLEFAQADTKKIAAANLISFGCN